MYTNIKCPSFEIIQNISYEDSALTVKSFSLTRGVIE